MKCLGLPPIKLYGVQVWPIWQVFEHLEASLILNNLFHHLTGVGCTIVIEKYILWLAQNPELTSKSFPSIDFSLNSRWKRPLVLEMAPTTVIKSSFLSLCLMFMWCLGYDQAIF